MEHVTDTACADTDEHFHKVRTGDGIERNIRLTGNCLCEQGLTGTGMTEQQDTLRHPCAHLLEFGRIFQIVDDLGHLFLFLITARNVIKFDLGLIFEPRSGFAEFKRPGICAACTVHLVHHPESHSDDDDKRNQRVQQLHEGVAGFCVRDDDFSLAQLFNQFFNRPFRGRDNRSKGHISSIFGIHTFYGDDVMPDGQRSLLHILCLKNICQLVIGQCLGRGRLIH